MFWKIITLILVYIIQAKIWHKLGELEAKEKQIHSKMLDEIIARDAMIKGLEKHIKNS
jgi:hypothetical protein